MQRKRRPDKTRGAKFKVLLAVSSIISFFLFLSIPFDSGLFGGELNSQDIIPAPAFSQAPVYFVKNYRLSDELKKDNASTAQKDLERYIAEHPRPLRIDTENPHEGSDEGTVLPERPVNPGIEKGLSDITRAATEEFTVSVTFDGGYDADEAGAVLDALKERGIRTTFFLTGIFIKRHPDIVRRIVSDGHEVGNHTMNHPHLTDYADTQSHKRLAWVDRGFLRGEIMGAADAFRDATGSDMAPLWRAPFGEVNMEIIGWAREAGYLHIGWTSDPRSRQSLDTLDWVADKGSRLYRSPGEIKQRLLNFGRQSNGLRGGIILMHLHTERKTDRLSSILGDVLDGLSEKGYRFVKVSELIQQDERLKNLMAGMESQLTGR